MTDLGKSSLPPQSTGKRQRTILLVDDEESILSSLRRLLRPDGYRILIANCGVIGLDLLAQNDVDVILSDQRMPGMTGVEFLRRVKEIYPHTVRMVLSGYTELQSITDAINEGAAYKFLTKPWEDGLLRANIEEAFRYKELNDENRRLNLEIANANTSLEQKNLDLQEALAAKDRNLELKAIVLGIAQEVLQCIPFPIVGLDNDDVVVFANDEASSVLSENGLLLGLLAQDVFPESLLNLAMRTDGETITEWKTTLKTWRVQTRMLGSQGNAHTGRLLILLPPCSER